VNHAVLWAPSMLPRPEVSFAPYTTVSFDLTLIGSGRSVTARLFLDDDGEMDGVLPTGVERRRLDRRIGMTPATSGTAACRPARTDMCRQLTGRMNSS
jgi:hypothetical protein